MTVFAPGGMNTFLSNPFRKSLHRDEKLIALRPHWAGVFSEYLNLLSVLKNQRFCTEVRTGSFSRKPNRNEKLLRNGAPVSARQKGLSPETCTQTRLASRAGGDDFLAADRCLCLRHPAGPGHTTGWSSPAAFCSGSHSERAFALPASGVVGLGNSSCTGVCVRENRCGFDLHLPND